jgi:hypothetical protein
MFKYFQAMMMNQPTAKKVSYLTNPSLMMNGQTKMTCSSLLK